MSLQPIRPLLGPVLMLLLAAGCGGGGGGNGAGASREAVGQSGQAVVVCAAGGTLEGVDVSEFQGTIDWNAVKGSGRAFAIARVSDGTGHLDPYFAANWSGIKAAGMVRGVYQFFEPGEDPVAQANLLISNVGTLAPDDLPPVADVEVSGGVSGSTLVGNLATWISTVQAGTGRTPMIYTAPGFWDPLPNTAQFGGDVLWVANWQVTCPDTPTPWTGWTFWQYADNGNVAGISGAVDLDRFNGTMLPSGGVMPDAGSGGGTWGAAYVGQSFPLASMALAMTENQSIASYIELRNSGSNPWDMNTKLATTQPRDRTSAFADSSWAAPNRPAAVSGTVAPGASYKFNFNLHAPSRTGTFFEYFGVVEDGVAWFSDPGQLGPQDNQLEVQVVVSATDYAGDFSAQSFPMAPMALSVHQGDVVDGWFELTNTGNKPWNAGVTKLAPTPRDKASPFADPSWLSPTRVSSVSADVPAGQKGRFAVKLDAAQTGDFQVTFGLDQDGVTWFADAPLGGGPPDDLLRVHLVVVPQGVSLDAGTPVLVEGGPASGDGGGGPGFTPTPAPASSGCGCRVAPEGSSLAPAALLASVVGLAGARRRRRRRVD